MKQAACLAGVLMVLAAGSVCRAQVGVGSPAPEITAQYWLNSPPLSLRALRGRIVVVEFWATWCGPCRTSIPHLVRLHNRMRSKGVVIVSLTDESRGKVESFAGQMNMTYPVGGGSNSSRAYGVRGIPRAFIVDPTGRIAWEGHPMGGLDRALEKQLQETPPTLISRKQKAAAMAALDRAEKAVTEGDHVRAAEMIARLGKVPDPDVTKRTAGLVETLKKVAAKRMDEGRAHLEAEEYAEAAASFETVSHLVPDSPRAKEAEARLAELMKDDEKRAAIERARLERRAALLLGKIRENAAKKHPAFLLRAYEQLAVRYPDTPAGKEAAARAEAMRADPDVMRAVRAAEAEKECKGWLSMARNYVRSGMPEKAEPYLKKVLEKYADTSYGAEARRMLAEIGGS